MGRSQKKIKKEELRLKKNAYFLVVFSTIFAENMKNFRKKKGHLGFLTWKISGGVTTL